MGNAGRQQQAQLAQLERIYQGQIAQQLLEQGVGLSDPARIDVRGKLVCGMDVSIDVNCVFEGQVQLGDGVQIGANCVIRNAQIAKGTQVAPFTHIDGATVGAGAKIGPFARLRLRRFWPITRMWGILSKSRKPYWVLVPRSII